MSLIFFWDVLLILMMVKWRWKCRQKLPGVSLEACSMWLPKRSVCTMFIWVRVSFWGSLFPVRIDKNMKKKTAKGKGKLQQCSQSCAHFESGNHSSNVLFQRPQHYATTHAALDEKGKVWLGWTHCSSTRLKQPLRLAFQDPSVIPSVLLKAWSVAI